MITLKNTAPSPRGIFTLTGHEVFAPGETKPVEISDAERDGLASYFEVVGASAPAPAAEPTPVQAASDIDTLRAEAKSLGIEVDARWREKRLQAEIDKALAS